MKKRRTGAWTILLASLMLVCAASTPGAADPTDGPAPLPDPDAIENLKHEISELRALVRALQDQMQALRGEQIREKTPLAAPDPPAILPPASAAPRTPGLLNPAISANILAIGNSSLRGSREENGFDLSEAEIALQAAVDPFTRVDLYLSFPDAESAEVEEGVITTADLPGPLQIRAGRFKNSLGKWNLYHGHQFFTVERPNALTNFFGEESLTTDGLSLSLLVPNPWDLYIDSLTEIGTARGGAAYNSERRALTYLQHLTAFFNPGSSSTIEAGITASRGRTGASDSLSEQIDSAGLSGTLSPGEELASAVQGFDFTWKWKPLQLNTSRSFLWQTEIFRSHRRVDVLTNQGSLRPGAVTSIGGYSYLEAQLSKRWKQGIRGDITGFPDTERAREWAASAVIRFAPSEFQELRFQVKHVRRNAEAALRFAGEEEDTAIFLEWIPVIGAHGAHKY